MLKIGPQRWRCLLAPGRATGRRCHDPAAAAMTRPLGQEQMISKRQPCLRHPSRRLQPSRIWHRRTRPSAGPTQPGLADSDTSDSDRNRHGG